MSLPPTPGGRCVFHYGPRHRGEVKQHIKKCRNYSPKHREQTAIYIFNQVGNEIHNNTLLECLAASELVRKLVIE